MNLNCHWISSSGGFLSLQQSSFGLRSVIFRQVKYQRKTERCALRVEIANWFIVMVTDLLEFLHKRQEMQCKMVSDKAGVDSGFPPVNLRKVAKLARFTRQIGSDGSRWTCIREVCGFHRGWAIAFPCTSISFPIKSSLPSDTFMP